MSYPPTDTARLFYGTGFVTDAISLLEPVQQTAVLADDPVLCVLAGAGTGKTRVLTLRVARRLEDRSMHANHALICTFSRKAANELRDRLWHLGIGSDVSAGTFHRAALRLITQYRAEHFMGPPGLLTDRRSLLYQVLEDPDGVAPRRSRVGAATPRAARHEGRGVRTELSRLDTEIGWAKARLVAPEAYGEVAKEARRRPGIAISKVAQIYGRYETIRRQQGLLDLDDLPWQAGDLLADDDSFARATRWWHRHIFVDEAQDLNEAQYRLLRLLVGDDPDLFVVGDPNQSVYGWNGADPRLLDRVTREFAGTRVLRLKMNHRCSPQIVRVATAALGITGSSAPTSTRPDGPVPTLVRAATDEQEARTVARGVWLAHRPGKRWSSIAVLSRTNAQLIRIAAALDIERVPYRAASGEMSPASDLTEPEDEEDGTSTTDSSRLPDDTGTSDAVLLSTFHRAKGLQWTAVFVIGLSDGLVPLVTARSTAARAEERRLLYVALTRAEDELSCSWAQSADETATSATTSRQPSPWLAAMQTAIDELRACASDDATSASEHLKRMRAQLPRTPPPTPGSALP